MVTLVTGCSVVPVEEGGAATCSVVVGAEVVGMDIVPLTTLFVVTTDTTASPIKIDELSDEEEFDFAFGEPTKANVWSLPSMDEPSSAFVEEIGASFSSRRSDEELFAIVLRSKSTLSSFSEEFSSCSSAPSSFTCSFLGDDDSSSSASFSSSSASG